MSSIGYLEADEELRRNADQWQAYESKGNCVVLAGPGSGKTKVLTTKIARLLMEDVRKPARIACITFSNACVGELRSRLRKLGVADDERLLLSTVHSFFLTELVSPYARIAGLTVPEPLVIASDRESNQTFWEAYKQVHHASPPSWFRTEFNRVRRTVLDRNGATWKDWTAPGKETQVIEIYEDLLLARGLVDFDGLVLTGLELVKGFEWVRRCLRAKYPVLVIDEYQDLGAPLHQMVVILMKFAGIRVLAVGDPDQSIYGFTGSKPVLLRRLSELDTVEAVELKLNYRCADQIIAASKALLTNPSQYKSHDGRKGEIRILRTGLRVKGQADTLLRTLMPQLLAANADWKMGDLAILYRSRNEGTLVAEAADALNIRYFRSDTGSPIQRSRLIDWLTDAARWCSGGWRTGEVPLSQLLKTWRQMRRSLTDPKEILEARSRLIAELFAQRDQPTALKDWLAGILRAGIKDILLNEPSFADEERLFNDLFESAKEGSLRDYDVQTFGNHGRHPDQINLMTLHGSKGLEFKAVAIVGLEAGELPNSRDRTQEQKDEARRLFYVGVTRAKDTVLLLFCEYESTFITQIRKASSAG